MRAIVPRSSAEQGVQELNGSEGGGGGRQTDRQTDRQTEVETKTETKNESQNQNRSARIRAYLVGGALWWREGVLHGVHAVGKERSWSWRSTSVQGVGVRVQGAGRLERTRHERKRSDQAHALDVIWMGREGMTKRRIWILYTHKPIDTILYEGAQNVDSGVQKGGGGGGVEAFNQS